MALIKCPECGKEFSNLANACPNCGYPIDEQSKIIAVIESKWKQYKKDFVSCNNPDLQADYYVKTIVRDLNLYIPQGSEEESLMVGFVGGFMENVERRMYDTPEKLEKMFSFINKDVQNHLKNYPRCPTCGSYAVTRISSLSRGIGFQLWGMASSKVGKSFKCEKCGLMW